MRDDGDWFAPKRFGLGAGLPIAWQGWVIFGLFGAAVLAIMAWLAPRHPVLAGIMVMILAVSMLVISARHTRGGWRWRWGGDE